ncbi:hypothetical protein P9112_001809 [Eukaryota sp. TZLM1-RC]
MVSTATLPEVEEEATVSEVPELEYSVPSRFDHIVHLDPLLHVRLSYKSPPIKRFHSKTVTSLTLPSLDESSLAGQAFTDAREMVKRRPEGNLKLTAFKRHRELLTKSKVTISGMPSMDCTTQSLAWKRWLTVIDVIFYRMRQKRVRRLVLLAASQFLSNVKTSKLKVPEIIDNRERGMSFVNNQSELIQKSTNHTSQTKLNRGTRTVPKLPMVQSTQGTSLQPHHHNRQLSHAINVTLKISKKHELKCTCKICKKIAAKKQQQEDLAKLSLQDQIRLAELRLLEKWTSDDNNRAVSRVHDPLDSLLTTLCMEEKRRFHGQESSHDKLQWLRKEVQKIVKIPLSMDAAAVRIQRQWRSRRT